MHIHTAKDKIWNLCRQPEQDKVNAVASTLGILPATARLLCQRGCDTPDSARSFIQKDTGTLHDPYLMRDMDRAVERIRRALVNREKIVIYGDYDVDGVTSVTILYSYLRIHSADVSYYIPSRVGEGYGINLDAIRSLAAQHKQLLITVDTGITAIDEIAEAARLGIDTVVTDHHECRPELPVCAAVVNPRRPDCDYPFKELAGVGVAFKLICALEQNLRSTTLYNATKFAAARCGDLVAVGTIADVMPLVDENRIIVSYGLKLLEDTKNRGLRALMHASGVMNENRDGSLSVKRRMTSSIVGFTLAPRINAAGRISNATVALELFLTERQAEADRIAAELCEINRRRQAEENAIIDEADKKIAEQCRDDDYVIVIDDDHWHHGVIGIVSSRLTERYNLPSILISFEGQTTESPDDDIGKGSGRSVKGMNLVDALEACKSSLVKYGGHELAAGLSIKRSCLAEFRRQINEYARKAFGDHEPSRTVDIDLKLQPEEISIKLANELYLLEPFGVANTQPLIETDGLIISEITPLSQRRHTRLTLRTASDCPQVYTALCFGLPTDEFPCRVGDMIDVVYNLDINEFRGRQSLQLLVKDIRLSEPRSVSEPFVPERDDFAKLYLYMKAHADSPRELNELAYALSFDPDSVSLMLDIFAELGLVSLDADDGCKRAGLLPVKGKINLEKSEIYSRLKRKSTGRA
ncbi:MAG TPA: single-stranded-DNA-specific exonuclease RecJ [Firmicutes bacterium]|nr:single-stranded-DNA-specific exonuclease RecJ [Bacillota bacterium]